MSDTELVERLAELVGIGAGYRDAWDEYREVPVETRRALLGAMGLEIGSEATLRAAIDARETADWRRTLPPVRVVRDHGQPPDVPLVTAEDARAEPHRWRLVTETGLTHEGEFRPADLPLEGRHRLENAGRERRRLALPLDPALAPGLGYHRLEIVADGATLARTTLIVCPESCYLPAALADGQRTWALAVQPYALRSDRNWGMGDFSDVAELTEGCHSLGADGVGMTPLHALFAHDPDRCAPYSPSSRLFLNTLYIDVEAVPEFADCERARDLAQDPGFQARLRAARESERIDYRAVAALKQPVLETLYSDFHARHLGEPESARGRAFRAFQREHGEALRRHALFEALQEHFHARDPAIDGWPDWPAAYRDPEAAEVAAFAAAHPQRIEFFQYLQWLADEQLTRAAERARECGLGLGLYRDLAVSVAGSGAEAWAHRGLHAMGASVGAPPDEFNLRGQDWGLPPVIPERLREAAYAPFVATLRANMRHAGAVRIDHAMGLMRLYWVPAGRPATDGAYVSYPLDDLLGIVALESRRQRCMVVGEDLGTVPDAIREAFGPACVHSYRVLYFEKRDDGALRRPADYPAQALASIGTHDLPTLAGFWAGDDLQLRGRFDLFPSDALRAAQHDQRRTDRAALLSALDAEALLPEGTGTDPAAVPQLGPELRRAVHHFLARAPARVMAVQPEDVSGSREQANLPGTTTEYPNWRHRYGPTVGAMATDPQFRAVAEAMAAEGRGRRVSAPAPGPPREAAPRATYRLQLGPGLGLRDATALVPWLDELGISHLYLSPILRARPGSAHGYDVVDHGALNPEIGERADLEALAAALRERGMGLIVDLVPNHMAIMGADNAWWLDVLEHGPASPHARCFDIDWQPPWPTLQGRVLVPVLGDRYGVVLEGGHLLLAFDAEAGTFAVHYHEHRFPLDPATYPRLLRCWPERLASALGGSPADSSAESADGGAASALAEIRSLATAFEHLPSRDDPDAARRAERRRDQALLKRRLAALGAAHPALRAHLEAVAAFFNGRAGEPASFEPLHGLLENQAYRLAHWRVAAEEINYRRFFDINHLAGLRVEDDAVFDATHDLLLELRVAGCLHGVRVDHPDGLYDPRAYLRRLSDRLAGAAPAGAAPAYVVVEKILADGEALRPDWPVHGTTGYEFANLVGRLLLDPGGERPLTVAWQHFTGRCMDFAGEARCARHLIVRRYLAGELTALASRIRRVAEHDWRTRDCTLGGLRDALAEVVARLGAYRSYITAEGLADADRLLLEQAFASAADDGAVDGELIDFLREVLLLRGPAPSAPHVPAAAWRAQLADIVQRLQQYMAAVTAKGIEDTAFYRYHRLVSLNEVGGDPGRFAASPDEVHARLAARADQGPHALLTTATHDTKRGEDTRARIHALSELSGEWRRFADEWRRINRPHRRRVGEHLAPAPDDEYLLYQTLVGAWPTGAGDGPPSADFVGRIRDYLQKASREAKRHTDWHRPDAAYEEALSAFVEAVLSDDAFLQSFAALQRRAAPAGLVNGLAQTLVKLAAPGVPDIYQGTELWDLSLVDPDNRRPVDYGRRRRLLAAVRELEGQPSPRRTARLAEWLTDPADGAAKLYLIRRALAVRRADPLLFRDGDYRPLATSGPQADRVFAFARTLADRAVVAAIPRLRAGLPGDAVLPPADAWEDTAVALPDVGGAFVDAITGAELTAGRDSPRTLPCAELFRHFPGALLVHPAPRTESGKNHG